MNTTMESLYGDIVSNWTRKDGRITLNVVVPPHSSAKIYLPTSDSTSITENGKPLGKVDGVTVLGMEQGEDLSRLITGNKTEEDRAALIMSVGASGFVGGISHWLYSSLSRYKGLLWSDPNALTP